MLAHETPVDTYLEWLLDFNARFPIASIERNGSASGGEVRRWFKNQAVYVDGKPVKANDLLDCGAPHGTVVLFPKGKRRTTLA